MQLEITKIKMYTLLYNSVVLFVKRLCFNNFWQLTLSYWKKNTAAQSSGYGMALTELADKNKTMQVDESQTTLTRTRKTAVDTQLCEIWFVLH